MNKSVLCVLGILSLTACKSRKILVKQAPAVPVTSNADLLKRNFFIKTDSADLDYQTFNAKGKLEIELNGSRHSASINVRIKKDQIIWAYINAGFLPVAQALITPDSIKVMNILQGVYTHKGFDLVKKYGGPNFTFKTLQAILTGNKPGGFISEDASYKILQALGFELSGMKDSLNVDVKFNQLFKPTDLDLENHSQDQHLHVTYSDFTLVGNKNIPQSIAISSRMKSNAVKLNLSYRKVDLNETLEFPFNSPAE